MLSARSLRSAQFVTATALLLSAAVAVRAADLSGAYGGSLPADPPTGVSATLSQTQRRLTGSLVLTPPDARLAGTYALRGVTDGTRIWLYGVAGNRARLWYRAQVTAGVISGILRLSAPGARLRASLDLVGRQSPGANGAQLFAQNCSACHGGNAAGLVGPDIRCNRAIHDTVRNGRSGSIGVMPAFAGMPDSDIAAIQEFLTGLCPAPSGAQVFAANCASCHGPEAGGQGIYPNIQCTVRSRVFDAVRKGRGNGAMPVFNSASLADADVELLSAHLAGLCDGSAAALFTSNCATCHGSNAAGGRNANGVRGPDIRCEEAHDFLETVQFGDGRMPAFPELSASTVSAIASFVQQTNCSGGGDD